MAEGMGGGGGRWSKVENHLRLPLSVVFLHAKPLCALIPCYGNGDPNRDQQSLLSEMIPNAIHYI